jgi:hypothetical protein
VDQGQVQLLLRDLGRLVGLNDLALDADGRCSLLVDERAEVEISFVDGEDHLILAARLGELPADAPPERYATLLDANFFWRGTNGGTLGVERDSRTVALLDTVPLAGLDVGRLEARLGTFVDTAEEWIGRLAEGAPDAGGAADSREVRAGEFTLRA